MSRLSLAISEGDGISVVPVLEGDLEQLAPLAEAAGAEAVAVRAEDAERARACTGLPILTRGGDPRTVAAAGGDGIVVRFDPDDEGGDLERTVALAVELGLDCAVDVRAEEELADALERVDPEIVLISERGLDDDEEDLERTLDLLADVPAGKLVISEARVVSREQVLALERAGVDAILVQGLVPGLDFGAFLEELVRGPETRL